MMNLVHGGDIYTARQEQRIPILDFSANINPLGMPLAAKQAICSAVNSCSQYPDPLCRELRTAISQKEEVPADWILCGNGAADLIFRLIASEKPRKAMVLSPTFAEYEQALASAGCEIVFHFLQKEKEFLLTERILDELDESLDLLFLCNPNNPTGQPTERELMERILKKCRQLGILLVADECFNDFLDFPDRYTLKRQLCEFPNLFLLKAFTKIYSMAGVRLGYAMCSDDALYERISGSSQPWSVSTLAQAAGVAALTDSAYLEQTRQVIREERTFLHRAIAALGLEVIGSKANYIFFRAEHRTDLREQLVKQGILIRGCGNYKGLDETYYRAAVKSREDNEVLLQKLAGIMKGNR